MMELSNKPTQLPYRTYIMKKKKIRPLRAKKAIAISAIVLASLLCIGAIFLIGSRDIFKRLEDSNS